MLNCTIWPHESDTISALYTDRKILNDFVFAERFGDILRFNHPFAGGRRIARCHGDIAVGAPMLAALIAQIEQRPQAALIALAPRRHSLAQPLRLGGDLAV